MEAVDLDRGAIDLGHLRGRDRRSVYDRQPLEALREFERERAVSGPRPGLELRMGLACQGAGDRTGARRHFERELEIDPGNARVRMLIEALEAPGR